MKKIILPFLALFIIGCSDENPEDTASNVPQVEKTVKSIEYKIFDSEEIKKAEYNLITAHVVASKEGDYKGLQIKSTLKDSFNHILESYDNAGAVTIWLYEREIDIKNGQSYTLGMLDWSADKGTFIYSICPRGEFARPGKMAFLVFDRSNQLVATVPEINDQKINKIIRKEMKITDEQIEKYFIEAATFNTCMGSKTITE